MTDLREFAPARPLVLVGCGNMGGAMLKGWLAAGLKTEGLVIVEPNPGVIGAHELDLEGAVIAADGGALDHGLRPRAVVFAVKPQIIPDAAAAFARFATAATVFLTIVAGKRIAFFEDRLGAKASVVRAMPNTPAAVGRAISVARANSHANRSDTELCAALLGAFGEVAWIKNEDWIDAVTAVSGSGPAYAFHLVECMARAGESAGLPAGLAMRLARAAVSGAGELLFTSPDAAALLRAKVTSPGGTTEAALEVLMGEDGLEALMTAAVAAAARRSRELSG